MPRKRTVQEESQDQPRRTLVWLELAVGAVLGLVLLLLNHKDLAQITWIVAAYQSLGRFVYARQLADELAPVRKLSEVVDLERRCSVGDVRTLLDLYLQITEDDFHHVKTAAVREATRQLSRLAFQKRSDTLATGEYYRWLLPMIADAKAGSEIWAVSMMLDCEWDRSEPERRFLQANLEAAKRGVTVRRVFVVPSEVIPQLPTHEPIAAQMDPSSNVQASLIEREYLENAEPNLMKSLGDGLIAFDQRVALIDQHSQDGSARGYVTMNANEIAVWHTVFESLLSYAEKLPDAVTRRLADKDGAVPA